jgi:hypothetical protein
MFASHCRMMIHRQIYCPSQGLTAVPTGAPAVNVIPLVKERTTRPAFKLTTKARGLPFTHRKSCQLYVFYSFVSCLVATLCKF